MTPPNSWRLDLSTLKLEGRTQDMSKILAITAVAARASGPANFTCDGTHLPANGATYNNFEVTGICTLENLSFTVNQNLEVVPGGGLNVRGNDQIVVHKNLTTDDGIVSIGAATLDSPTSLTVDGSVSDTGADFYAEDLSSGEHTSPVTFLVGGNFTANHVFNIRLANFGGGPFASVISVAGHTTISDVHSGITLGAGTFGPITIRDINDTFTTVDIEFNKVNGTMDVSGNTDLATAIVGNQISGNLTCDGNSPPPIDDGFPNTVFGLKTGQCAEL